MATGGPQATVDVNYHVKLLLIIMDHRRVDRAGLLAFPLLFWTLAANILNGLRDGDMVTIDSNPGKLSIQYPIMEK